MPQTLSIVAICSNALTLLGEQTITSLTDGTTRANLCNAHFPSVRDETFEELKPNFAKALIKPPKDITVPTFKWEASYTLPSDFITVVEVLPRRIDYEIVGLQLFTNANGVEIIYIRREADTTKWTSLFASAVMYKLAMRLSIPLKNDPNVLKMMTELYEVTRRRAMIEDAQQEPTKPLDADDLLLARLRP
jgi:hypothetical protein